MAPVPSRRWLTISGRHLAGGPALARTARRAVLPLVFENELAIVDADVGRSRRAASRRAAWRRSARSSAATAGTAWVSHWGGRWPKDGDPTLPTGTEPNADRVVVDAAASPSTGTMARIDLETRTVTATVDVGLHPTALAWDEARQRLYVANANSDTISVVDTAAARVSAHDRAEAVRPDARRRRADRAGVAPDGDTLYAALGGFNAVAVHRAPRTAPCAG